MYLIIFPLYHDDKMQTRSMNHSHAESYVIAKIPEVTNYAKYNKRSSRTIKKIEMNIMQDFYICFVLMSHLI